MKTLLGAGLLIFGLASASLAQEVTGSVAPSLTIYNQKFAVVRETVQLPLRKGENRVTFAGTTAQLEPDSVVLRDLSGKRDLKLLEQNYEANAISAGLLLSRFEGKALNFLVRDGQGGERTITGKVTRSGYVQGQSTASGRPMVEVDGKIRFGLPGTPLFPALDTDVNLRPTLSWTLFSNASARVEAELSYVSGGLTWEAGYNLIVPDEGDVADFTGLITIANQSGKGFPNAYLQLMAGDISKLVRHNGIRNIISNDADNSVLLRDNVAPPVVTARAFDEYHLYTLGRPTTLKDRETKQVEFVHAEGIKTRRIYIYNGAATSTARYNGYSYESIRDDRNYGTESNSKVWVMREVENTKLNKLGIALPAGRARFYRRDRATKGLQFIGENRLDHTPQGETLRIYTGNTFDIVGERRQTNYEYQSGAKHLDETFDIILHNRKKTAATVRVVEQLYRGSNWKITASDLPFVKKDSHTIEFSVPLAPNQERKITYTVRYSW